MAYQITAQHGQSHQGREDQPASESQIQSKEIGERRNSFVLADLRHHLGIKSRSNVERLSFLLSKGTEQGRHLPHAVEFFLAHLTTTQMRLDFPKSCRLQRTAQVLFQVIHRYSVH